MPRASIVTASAPSRPLRSIANSAHCSKCSARRRDSERFRLPQGLAVATFDSPGHGTRVPERQSLRASACIFGPPRSPRRYPGVAVFALAASRSAHAQVTVDVTKVNCDQFVHHKISEPRLIAAWLSGYYNAKRNNRVIDLQTFEENMSKVQNFCSDEKNFKVPCCRTGIG
jgi:acid stress chaperone HdeB